MKCEAAGERRSFSKDPAKQDKGTKSNGEAGGSTICRAFKKSEPELEVIKWIIHFGQEVLLVTRIKTGVCR